MLIQYIAGLRCHVAPASWITSGVNKPYAACALCPMVMTQRALPARLQVIKWTTTWRKLTLISKNTLGKNISRLLTNGGLELGIRA